MDQLEFVVLERLQLDELDRRGANITADNLLFSLSKHGSHLVSQEFEPSESSHLYEAGYQKGHGVSRTCEMKKHTTSVTTFSVYLSRVLPLGTQQLGESVALFLGRILDQNNAGLAHIQTRFCARKEQKSGVL
ncbi:MAG TPA: hypothetical protein VLT32_13965 [Candidatus Sulfomarinibacteraceae bacterium]|nr:hypothetical protein [Candidatus Sulfomarinibacteraceae bacterium]